MTDAPQPTLRELIRGEPPSKCCRAPLRVECSDPREGTNYYVCTKCGQPSDPVGEGREREAEQPSPRLTFTPGVDDVMKVGKYDGPTAYINCPPGFPDAPPEHLEGRPTEAIEFWANFDASTSAGTKEERELGRFARYILALEAQLASRQPVEPEGVREAIERTVDGNFTTHGECRCSPLTLSDRIYAAIAHHLRAPSEQDDTARLEELQKDMAALAKTADIIDRRILFVPQPNETTARRIAARILGLIEELLRIRPFEERLKWLHSCDGTTDKDAEGYEWGVYRVKWDAHGKVIDVQQTLSDMSDLDSARSAPGKGRGET